jgi:hypothetical protein
MNIQGVQSFIDSYPALFVAITLWTLIWKGLALWKAGKRKDRNWFIIILVLNTFGILDIIYYYFVGKREGQETEIVQ